uniref:Uncharacterized protein n=1 Tax=Acrobeloides nanus TaxID=290746 RepID=A0A914BZZ9_9BILA
MEIQFKRCLCIHSTSQAVEIILQHLLYSRAIIPQPVANLLKNESQNRVFCEKYGEIRNILRMILRASNSQRVLEFVILFGASPNSAKEIYRIPLKFCDIHEATESCSNENCGELSAREKRDVFTALIQSTSPASLSPLSSTSKVFLFVRVTEKLPNQIENLEHDDSFEMPDEAFCLKRKIYTEILWIKHRCSEDKEMNQSISDSNEGIWLRFMFFLNKLPS